MKSILLIVLIAVLCGCVSSKAQSEVKIEGLQSPNAAAAKPSAKCSKCARCQRQEKCPMAAEAGQSACTC